MKQNLAVALGAIGVLEGGFANHPRDPGGATMNGVTKRVYEAVLGRSCTIAELQAISDSTVAAIFTEQYGDKVLFNDLPSGLDVCVFDCAVNSGPSRAIKILQAALGFKGRDVDGAIGSLTLDAVDRAGDGAGLEMLIADYDAGRLAFMRSLKTWSDFGVGWTRRVHSIDTLALSLATGAPSLVVRPVIVAQGKAVGAVKVSATRSGVAAIASTVVAAGAGASQLSAALTPYADIPAVRYSLVALALVAAVGTWAVAFGRTQDGATT